MKTNFNKLLILASAGALTGLVWADEVRVKAGADNADTEIDLRSDASISSSREFQRASDLMGLDVFNQQNEKIGEIKDVMVDLQSGRAPFAVISSGGFFGVGDRFLAVPTGSFFQSRQGSLSLNVDKERLQSAPGFDRAAWPDMSDEAWSSQVYSFYGEQPVSSSYSASTTTIINEPAGSNRYQSSSSIPGHSSSTSQEFGETTSGLHRDRTPRQGLGAEDLTRNEQKIYNPGGYAESDSYIQTEASGAERSQTRVGGHTTSIQGENREGWTRASASQQSGKVRRASEMIGMEVENAQGERVGEIKDVVLDLESGRVAYTVLSASGYADMTDRLYAVPPAVFTRSSDERSLVLNTDKEMLKTAPSFEKNNWSESNNRQFTTEVYRHYKQPLYWQSSGEIREPSGSELNQNNQRDSSGKWERGNNPKEESRPEIQEPSGAEPDQTQPNSSSPDVNSGATTVEPSGAEPEREQSSTNLQPDQSQSSAAKETQELNANPTQGAAAEANQDAAAQEPAGAATATTPATSEDQAGNNSDRNLSERLRTELKNDAELSAKTQNVQVSSANGRITLRGSVASEQEKKDFGMKAQTITGSAEKVDNQLRVTSEPPTP